jgi:hypothetical protein
MKLVSNLTSRLLQVTADSVGAEFAPGPEDDVGKRDSDWMKTPTARICPETPSQMHVASRQPTHENRYQQPNRYNPTQVSAFHNGLATARTYHRSGFVKKNKP